MRAYTVFGRASAVLSFPAVICTLLLYLYPLFLRCSFPEPAIAAGAQCVHGDNDARDFSSSSARAPFRLLALGDPQLEGDSSLPEHHVRIFRSVQELWTIDRSSGIWSDLKSIFSFIKVASIHDLPLLLWSYRKRLDLLGNDYYLAHIYRTLHWWLEPTHVTALGDLIGSQWVSDVEFERRGSRFWNIVFRHGRRVEDSVTGVGPTEILGQDVQWSQRVINVAGNHDIGYAGDINPPRLERFERTFGKANWDIKFNLPSCNSTADAQPTVDAPQLHLVVLNNMNLDSPAYDPNLQQQTYDFINVQVIDTSRPVEDRTAATVLLTHIPLHKEAGVCVDAPFFDYHALGIKEQNTLSPYASGVILEGIFGISGRPSAPANGVGRNGVILTGHDHEGCSVYHYTLPGEDPSSPLWKASNWENRSTAVVGEVSRGVREITVRSMMGSFGGNAGLLSGWFDNNAGEWRFEYATCPLGVQHIWWAVHVLDLVTLACGAVTALLVLAERFGTPVAKFGAVVKKRATKSPATLRTPRVKSSKVAPGSPRSTPLSKRASKNNLKDRPPSPLQVDAPLSKRASKSNLKDRPPSPHLAVTPLNKRKSKTNLKDGILTPSPLSKRRSKTNLKDRPSPPHGVDTLDIDTAKSK